MGKILTYPAILHKHMLLGCKEVWLVLVSTTFIPVIILDDKRYVKANAGCKHFDVHGGPENIPVSRFDFDAKVIIERRCSL